MLTPPRAPRSPLAEVARWEWRRGDGGDPVVLAAAFLAAHWFAVAPLGAAAPAEAAPAEAAPARPGDLAGAALLLGAGALPADLATLPPAAPSPCPEVPDAAVVVYVHGRTGRAAGAVAGLDLGPWTPSWTPAEHAAAAERVRQAIARGDLYQANVVGHRSAPVRAAGRGRAGRGRAGRGRPGDGAVAAAVAARLAGVGGTPYAGSLAGDGWSVHSASPECFLEVSDGVARVRPIKGTAAGAAALRGSAKDRAEHVMIVDLERNDLGRVAVPGTVRVPVLYDVVPRAGVWHAESTVEARLRPGTGLAELLAATFPGGSVTGAPKRAALALLHGLEPVGRGPSMGAFGWVWPDGRADLGLSIRTFALAGGRLHLWTGGGVTWGSDPAAEVAEAEAKAAPLLRALGRVPG